MSYSEIGLRISWFCYGVIFNTCFVLLMQFLFE